MIALYKSNQIQYRFIILKDTNSFINHQYTVLMKMNPVFCQLIALELVLLLKRKPGICITPVFYLLTYENLNILCSADILVHLLPGQSAIAESASAY